MLAVDHRLAAGGDRRFDAVDDAGEVLLQRAAERDVDVIVPGLGDEDDRVGVGGEQAARPGSLAAERPGRLVMPKAQKRARLVGLRSKKRVSIGLAPG